MGRLGAIWYSVHPLYRTVAVISLIGAVIIAVYILWPAPGPSVTEQALQDRIEERDKQILAITMAAAQMATASAQSFQTGVDSMKESDNAKAELPALRVKRQGVRSAGKVRADELAATPDDQLRVAHDRQLERTRAALKRALSASESDTPGSVVPVHP